MGQTLKKAIQLNPKLFGSYLITDRMLIAAGNALTEYALEHKWHLIPIGFT